ncbi:abortive infection family protein [Nesterenkonia sp. K-15-9-6]|uniref:abortive infection family protein n=1 Tax=Nesterenkonia sp. K-15-9-6 TaxID=3093918 RepID=UPI0040450CA2
MNNEDLWAVGATFSEIMAEHSPPTHNDLDVAFRRAGVDSPQEDGPRYLSKPKRIANAFEVAAEESDERIDRLIVALTTALTTRRLFESKDQKTLRMLRRLHEELARLGWTLSRSGDLSRSGPISVQTGGRAALEIQLKRLRNADSDVSLMLGAAKDTLEAAAKFVITEQGQEVAPTEPVEALVNRAMALADISTRPQDATDEASKALATINQAVPKIAEAVRRIRNDQGAGHGRTVLASVTINEARFTRDLTLSVVGYLLAEHQMLAPAPSPTPLHPYDQ